MRTTLDIDDDVLQAAKELAFAERKTAGRVLSDLARKGLTSTITPAGACEMVDDIPLLPSSGTLVTKELVDRLIEEADLEEGRLSLRK
jgi:hypothetical protein